MLKNIFVIFSLVAAAYGSGQFTILQCPEQIKLPKASMAAKIDGKLLGSFLRACTGYSMLEPVPLKVELPPFDLAQKTILVNIEGIPDFTSKTLKPKSEIELTGPENNFESFPNILYEKSASMVTMNLNDGMEALLPIQDWCETPQKTENTEILKAMKDSEKDPELKQFVEAIAVLSILSKAKCQFPDYLQIDLNVNEQSRDKYKELFVNEVITLSEDFSRSTKGNGLFAVLTSPEKLSKRTRRAAGDEPQDLNLAESYSEDYPVIFNIILWFGVLIVFSMLAITYAIAGMDPGRDSIIYRMTSTRIKKDN